MHVHVRLRSKFTSGRVTTGKFRRQTDQRLDEFM